MASKLLVCDIEGTLFQTKIRLPDTSIDSTIWQAIAHSLGAHAIQQEISTHSRWHRGEYNTYLDWVKDTIRIHRDFGLTEIQFRDIIHRAEYNPGVVETFEKLDRSKFEVVLVSGGFRELAQRAQCDLKISHAFAACEYYFDPAGRLAWYNLLPCDFEGKLDFIHLMLREYGLSPSDWIFIGDGLNDVPVAKTAPVSIAYNAHPALKEVATFHVSNFDEVLHVINILFGE